MLSTHVCTGVAVKIDGRGNERADGYGTKVKVRVERKI